MPEVEARKSYMTKEQLETYLSDLRSNKPQRPNGARPLSSAAKHRWSTLSGGNSSTSTPEFENGPPTLVSPVARPELTRRESRLLQKHSTPTHKRASTASSILSFKLSPGKTNEQTTPEEWDSNTADDRPDSSPRTTDDAPLRTSPIRPRSFRRRRDTMASFRGFTSISGANANASNSGTAPSISSLSSSSSGNSEGRKKVQWGSIPRSNSPPPVIMPPCHPPKAEDSAKIEVELAAHFDALSTQVLPTVAPLRISKSEPSAVPPLSRNTSIAGEKLPPVLERDSPVPSQRSSVAPLPPRKNYTEPWMDEPSQVNKVLYRTNPNPVPSPPTPTEPEVSEADILKDLGRKHNPKGVLGGPRELSKNNLRYGAQVQEQPTMAIGVVESFAAAPVVSKGTPPPMPTVTADEPSYIPSPSMCVAGTRPLPRVNQPSSSSPVNTSNPPSRHGTPRAQPIPSINIGGSSASSRNSPPRSSPPRAAPTPSINISSTPTINFPDDDPPRPTNRGATQSTSAIPIISFPDDPPSSGIVLPSSRGLPTINFSTDRPTPSINFSTDRPTPSINFPSQSTPAVPTISFPTDAPRASPSITTSTNPRPLPRPRPQPSSSTRTPSAACNLCRTPIQGRIVSASSLRFHPACFRCAHCSTSLEHAGFFPEPASARRDRLEASHGDPDSAPVKFYCHLDFHELFSPRCKSCSTPIEGEVVVACGNTWHKGHFFCAECGDPFDESSRFVEKDGYAWCVGCFGKRYSGKCRKCKRPVVETVVRALGGDWHEECFGCVECNASFEDGRFFVRTQDGKEVPVCVKCEEKRLKA